jgi:hypothetical protein
MRESFHVTKTSKGWEGHREGKERPVAKGTTKKEVVSEMIRVAKHHQPSSLMIHKVDGKIQEERTYPRSSDPRKYKG